MDTHSNQPDQVIPFVPIRWPQGRERIQRRSISIEQVLAFVRGVTPEGRFPVKRIGTCREEPTKSGARNRSGIVRVYEVQHVDTLRWFHEALVTFAAPTAAAAAAPAAGSPRLRGAQSSSPTRHILVPLSQTSSASSAAAPATPAVAPSSPPAVLTPSQPPVPAEPPVAVAAQAPAQCSALYAHNTVVTSVVTPPPAATVMTPLALGSLPAPEPSPFPVVLSSPRFAETPYASPSSQHTSVTKDVLEGAERLGTALGGDKATELLGSLYVEMILGEGSDWARLGSMLAVPGNQRAFRDAFERAALERHGMELVSFFRHCCCRSALYAMLSHRDISNASLPRYVAHLRATAVAARAFLSESYSQRILAITTEQNMFSEDAITILAGHMSL
eukprot:m51a1_g2126 hypothetical protein (389) ;mRNA; r:1686456-1688114